MKNTGFHLCLWSLAFSVLDADEVHISREDQVKSLRDEKERCLQHILVDPYPPGLYCNRTFDAILCWPDTAPGTTAYQPCPKYINGFDTTGQAAKECLPDGTWYVHPNTNSTWTNYTKCLAERKTLSYAQQLDTFDYSYYEETIAPAAKKLDRQVPDGIMGSLLKYPELRFEPSLKGFDNTVFFTKGRPSTQKAYTDKLTKFYEGYDPEHHLLSNVIDCRAYSDFRFPDKWDKSCRVDRMELGFTSCIPQQEFGYDDGLPCIFLSLDRVYNWLPEPYRNESVPEEIRDAWLPGYVTVKCEGTDPVSVDNLCGVSINPPNGFHFKYFPDNGSEAWMSPLVSISVCTTPGVAVELKCTIWARNTMHNDLLNTGSVKFTVLVD